MSNPNKPYVLELAAMIHTRERAGTREGATEAGELRDAAERNGVASAQLQNALVTLAALPDQSGADLEEWVRQQYLADGRDKGYVGQQDEPTLWVLGQLAEAYYSDQPAP